MLFFAGIREHIGHAKQEITVEPGATVGELWQSVGAATVPGQVLHAVNEQYCNADTPLQDGDCVAFFPPLTGG